MEAKKRNRVLRSANQAEILRSHQRDDDFVKHLREKLIDLAQTIGRQRGLLPFVHSDVPFRLIYFFFTSGMGNQTLGEEYTGIVQANLGAHKVPSLLARVVSVILECFGEKALLRMLKRLQLSVNHPRGEFTPEASRFLNAFVAKARSLIPILVLIHKGLFYMYGRYYSLGKRVARIDYAKVYGQRPTDGISWGLRLLGAATLAQCLLKICRSDGESRGERRVALDEKRTRSTCQLCLENVPTTATPCGHLFCWFCLADWLNAKPQCPLCREHVEPSRMVQVMNL